MTAFYDNESLTNFLIIDYYDDSSDDEDYMTDVPEKVSVTKKKKKVRKCVKRGFICCFKFCKYTFLCCRCVIVWRCLWLLIIFFVGCLIFTLFYYDDVRKIIQFIYIVIDTSIHLYKRLEDQNKE